LVSSQTCQVGPEGPQLWGYDVVAEFPHDSRAFTQGLQYDTVCNAAGTCSEVFWESTGTHVVLQQPPPGCTLPGTAPAVLQQLLVNSVERCCRPESIC
jgi:hypothetical protein